MKKSWLAILLVIVSVIIIFGTTFFFDKNIFAAPLNIIRNYSQSDLLQENADLKMENENLKAQIQKNQVFCASENNQNSSAIIARVYSTYPFNFKNTVTINKGSKQGINKGMIAYWGDNILIGQVTDVYDDYSVIKTVFDPNWQLPVKIGNDKINGLFKGGNTPKITLIEKPINSGDPVFTASSDFPLDLKIGEIQNIKQSAGGVFEEATIKTPYNFNEIEDIFVK